MHMFHRHSVDAKVSVCVCVCVWYGTGHNAFDYNLTFSSLQSSVMSLYDQWRRQRSKGATSFRGQKILKPGHPELRA